MTNSPKDSANLEKRMETRTRLSVFGMALIEALKERLNALEPKAPSQETVRRDLDAWGDREESMAASPTSETDSLPLEENRMKDATLRHSHSSCYPDLCCRIALLERRLVSTDRERVGQIEALKERLQETVRREREAWGDREEAMAAIAAGNAPPHYARMPAGYHPIDVAEKWITSAGDNVTPYQAALWFQIVKYAGRWPHNSPTADLRKLIDYAQRLLAALEGNR